MKSNQKYLNIILLLSIFSICSFSSCSHNGKSEKQSKANPKYVPQWNSPHQPTVPVSKDLNKLKLENEKLKKIKNKKGLNLIEVRRNHFITLRALPNTIKDLKKVFKERPNITRQVVTGHHHHTQNPELSTESNSQKTKSTDEVVVLKFTGAEIRLYQNQARPNSEALLGLQLTQAKPQLKLGLDIKVARQYLEPYLGIQTQNKKSVEVCEIQEQSAGGPIYGSSCVNIEFKGDRIHKMHWVLPLD